MREQEITFNCYEVNSSFETCSIVLNIKSISLSMKRRFAVMRMLGSGHCHSISSKYAAFTNANFRSMHCKKILQNWFFFHFNSKSKTLNFTLSTNCCRTFTFSDRFIVLFFKYRCLTGDSSLPLNVKWVKCCNFL